MESHNKNQYVLITGASQGLGLEFAKLFANEKYNLVLVARNKEALESLARDLQKEYAIFVKILIKDLSLLSSPSEIYAALQDENIPISILVNNAGFATHGEFSQSDLSHELEELQVNIVSLTQLTKLFVKDMVNRKEGKILMIASTAAFLPGPYMAVYYASKSYVLSFSQALREELKGTGVSITTLCPGPTRTGFAKRAAIEHSLLFNHGIMEASVVAKNGFKALFREKAISIPGIRNNITVLLLRFIPLSVAARMAGKLQK